MDLREAGTTTHRHPWETARLWVLRQLVRAHVQIEPGAVIVDIGCGDAFVLGELAREYPKARCFGVDAALDAAGIAERQRSLPANVRLFESLDEVPSDAPARLILLMDVLEHIEEDGDFLINLKRRPITASSTQLVVTVPAFQSLFSAHDVFLKHFRRYSSGQLRRRLEQVGLQVNTAGYFFSGLLPIRVMQVMAERLVPSREDAATGLRGYSRGSAVTNLMHRALVVDASIALRLRRIGVTLPGLSTYAVCRASA